MIDDLSLMRFMHTISALHLAPMVAAADPIAPALFICAETNSEVVYQEMDVQPDFIDGGTKEVTLSRELLKLPAVLAVAACRELEVPASTLDADAIGDREFIHIARLESGNARCIFCTVRSSGGLVYAFHGVTYGDQGRRLIQGPATQINEPA